MAHLELRYIAGEIDQVQVQDEVLRWYRPDIAPAAGVRPLPPEQPGRVYPYAAEMAALMQDMNELPPYMPYTVMEEGIPWLSNYLDASVKVISGNAVAPGGIAGTAFHSYPVFHGVCCA